MTNADSSVSAQDRKYVYDAAWNLNYRTNNTTANTFKVDGKNQLTNATPVGTQTYDDNGNMTASSGAPYWYAYDDENQLANIYYYQTGNGNGSPTSIDDYRTEFVYDGKGRLRKRVEYYATGAGPYTWVVMGETRFLYDGMRVIQERNSSNTPTVSYTRGTDLSGSLEGAGGIGGLLGRSHTYSAGNWSTHNVYFADGNGNVTYMLDSTQTKVAEYRYDPFGNTISSSGSLATANVYRFSSKELYSFVGLTTLYYYGYRWYDPNLQRWPNRDPIGELGFEVLRYHNNTPLRIIRMLERIGGFNLYGFVRNQPTVEYDSLGLASILCEHALEQAEAAVVTAENNPTPANIAAAAAAVAYAQKVCLPPLLPPLPPPEPNPNPFPIPSPAVVKKSCFWATVGVVTYWVCSEALRVLCPPRNLIPIP